MRALLAAFVIFISFFSVAHAQAPLHPGDMVEISVWQDPKLDRRVVVGPDGMIGFPLVGQLRVGGLTPAEVENLLRTRLQKNYTEKLDITVARAALNRDYEDESKPKVYVSGEVLRPGPYFVRPTINVMQALSLAGGLGPFAAKQRIQLHRKINGIDSIFIFDYNAYLAGTNTADNINLRSGDIIVVPERGLFE